MAATMTISFCADRRLLVQQNFLVQSRASP
jgi:hypothetical protein